MTLFTLLIVMALERVTTKSKRFHIANIAESYFNFIQSISWLNSENKNFGSNIFHILLIAGIPALIVLLAVQYLPGLIVFCLYLLVLWVCLGCPVTRNTYRRYMQAANRDDFEACSLYSEKFGVEGGELSSVGKQLVLVNYRQYASVIIFFVFLGPAGVIFYSLCKEWYLFSKKKHSDVLNNVNTSHVDESLEENLNHSNNSDNVEASSYSINNDQSPFQKEYIQSQTLLSYLDFIPVRLTSFGFLLVGHFSKGLPIWLGALLDLKISSYELLAKVAKASEEPEPYVKPYLQEPLQMVKLVKRNVLFLIMAISIMTMVGLLG